MKAVTLDQVRARIARIELLNSRGVGTAIEQQQFELACLRELLALRERAEPFGYYSPEVPTILEQQGHANINRECAGEYRLPLYAAPPAPPAPVVPEDVLAALRNVAKIRLDFNDFDGDRRGMADCLGEAEEALIEVVNRRAAMLQPVSQPYKLPGKEG
ncbi:hypothetical protein ACM915_000356 [Cronobacter turicensis]